MGNIKIHSCRFLYRAQELIEYKILVNDVEFIVLDKGFRYKRGILGSHRSNSHFVTYTTGLWEIHAEVNLEQIINLYIKLKSIVNTNDFQVSMFDENGEFLFSRYFITIGVKKFYVHHQYADNIEKRLLRDAPYLLK